MRRGKVEWYLVNDGEWVLRLRRRPRLVRKSMQEGDHVLDVVLGEISGPVMQDRQDVVGRVLGVDAPLLEEVAVALFPLLKVPFLSRFDVLRVDVNEVVPVRPRMLMDEAKGVEKLVDRGHQVILETFAGERGISYVDKLKLLPIVVCTCSG